jgi:hypothetical protein
MSNDILEKGQQTTISQLTQKSSLDIKRERHIETVPFTKIEKLIPDNTTGREIYSQIGLGAKSFNDDMAKGKARKVTFYAILGLLSEHRETHTFSYDELCIILGALIHHTKSRSEPFKQEIADIQKIIMRLMLDMD